MAKKCVGQQKIELVLERIRAACEADSDDREMYRDALGAMLDDLHGNDAFGTEGQCDPRGDFRNGEWTMKRIEGFVES
jgi:aminoglycoside phosphotransferase (APT) family kinase protein